MDTERLLTPEETAERAEHLLYILRDVILPDTTFEAFVAAKAAGEVLPPLPPAPKPRPLPVYFEPVRRVPASPTEAWRDGWTLLDWQLAHGGRAA